MAFDLMTTEPEKMDRLVSVAEIMSTSKVTVPKHFQGSQGDCLAVCMQAAQWGMNPFAVAQQAFLVNGTLGFSAQLVNAVIGSSDAISGRFKFEYDWPEGAPNGLVRCGAVLKGETDITWGEWIDTSKLTVKNSPNWKSAPKQQAAYQAVKMWARLYTPDVILGVYTPDEIEARPVNVTPTEAVEAAIAGDSHAETPALGLDDAIGMIKKADSLDALHELKADLTLLSAGDKREAVKVYREKERDLSASEAETVDLKTGEIKG